MSENSNYDINLRIVSKPVYLCVVRSAISAALERLGLDEPATARVMLAVDEAVTNVIRHGYDNAHDKPIWVRFRPVESNGRRRSFEIVVEDRAKQVDPEIIRGRDLADVRPGGLGVHIIREVMDEVEYTKREGGGMRLFMSKTFVPAEAPA
jgi:anti-sigma regulatory factor (Ser/Thr protein kinase)